MPTLNLALLGSGSILNSVVDIYEQLLNMELVTQVVIYPLQHFYFHDTP